MQPPADSPASSEAAAVRTGWVLVWPNRNSFGLLFVLLAMGYAGASQNNSAAYLLGFLTLSLGLVSTLHCWRNLRGLRLSAEPLPAVFAGETRPLRLTLRQLSGRTSRAVEVVTHSGQQRIVLDAIPPGPLVRGELLLTATGRGRFHSLQFRVESSFPLGFSTAHQSVTLPLVHYVYPQPEGDLPLPLEARTAPSNAAAGRQPEGDDFAGVRDWRPGESMRHIDWKAAARSDRLMVKQWTGAGAERLVFSWADLPADFDPERKLRQLARWIVLATRLNATFALHLPDRPEIPQGTGEAHFHTCLRALAAWPEE